MLRTSVWFCVCLLLIGCAVPVAAQQPAAASNTSNAAVVPPLVSFSGVLTDDHGKPLSGVVGVTFALYKDSQGGAPLWLETQNVYPDKTGHYTVLLGSTTSSGLPADLFVAGEARWLGVQPERQAERPRVSLLSVPYALKAADAQTVGGLPASAFVLAAPGGASTGASPGPAAGTATVTPNVAGTGTQYYVPLWTDNAGTLGNSVLYQTGTGSTAKTGIGTTTPAVTLDVNGSTTVRGLLNLPAAATATASAGSISRPFGLVASTYNSSTANAANQVFRWQAEPVGNNTASPSATLNLLFATAPGTPAETGLNIASNGQITFATGQTFPGNGTVTSVSSGAGLTGGPITTSGTLSIAAGGVTNAMLATPSLTIAPGIDLTGGGTVALGGTTTLSLDTTKVPQLATGNTFTGNQTVNGNLSATGAVAGNSFQIGSNRFAFGSYSLGNAFLGFAGNPTTTGNYNTASGYQALYNNTTGNYNTASGYQALLSNNTGNSNTASGFYALHANTKGGQNTATGNYALATNTTGGYNTANGYFALYGNTTGSSNTASGFYALYANTTGNYNTAHGGWALYANTTGANNTASGYRALGSNITGNYDTASGASALYHNTTGYSNTASGYYALLTNTTGGGNTAIGMEALEYSTTANWNTATGYVTLLSNTTGQYSTADGAYALYANTAGGQNTAVGFAALDTNTTGSDLTCVGYECSTSADGLTNATAIGAHAVVGRSNSLVLGGTGQYGVKVGIGTATPSNVLTIAQGAGQPLSDGWATFSSRRWKTNIQTLHGALGKVEQLRGVAYDLKANGKHEVGVIAEEVGAVVPEVVTWEENGKDAQSVDYGRLTALLIEATKEQQTLIHTQQEQIRVQQAQLKIQQEESKLQRAQIARLTSQVKAIQTSLNTSGRTDPQVRVAKAQPSGRRAN